MHKIHRIIMALGILALFVTNMKFMERIGFNNTRLINILSSSSSSSNKYEIEFVTDVEGDFQYFKALIDQSTIIRLDENNELDFTNNPSDHELKQYFVYGGDTVDRGFSDIKIVKLLNNFKSRYPNNVFFILGNRDANHLNLLKTFGTIKHVSQVTSDHIKQLQSYIKRLSFEYRRKELISLKQNASDAHVFMSFYNSVNPNKSKDEAWLLEYVQNAEIIKVIDDNLFVHGGWNHKIWKSLHPNKNNKLNDSATVFDWIQALNQWKIDTFESISSDFVYKDKKIVCTSWEYLIPNRNNTHHNYALKMNQLEQARTDALKWVDELYQSGIRAVFAGHKPLGDSPIPIRLGKNNLLIMSADTGRSSTRTATIDDSDTRAGAYANIRITNNHVYVSGQTTSDIARNPIAKGVNIPYAYILTKGESHLEIDSKIGHLTEDKQWLIVYPLSHQDTELGEVTRYVKYQGDGWTTSYKV